jgi:hypothetical protein
MVLVKEKWNCLDVSGTVRFRFAGLRNAGKTVRSSVGGSRSTPFTGAGDRATPAAPRPRSRSISVRRPPVEWPMMTGGVPRLRMILS